MTIALVIAGTNSGVGKTSIALGMMRALWRRGLRIQPFKVGPDYLDPIWHKVAAGQTSYNLDAWMTSGDYVKQLFASKAATADVAIIEGVMGLFDGASPTSLAGSTAEIARLLEVPVLLVANAHGVSRSFAATVRGFAEFEDQCQVTHVIANHCGSQRHAEMLDESLVAAGLNQLSGAINRNSLPQLPSRHLGLSTPADQSDADDICNQLAECVERSCDIDALLANTVRIDEIKASPPVAQTPRISFAPAGGRLAVAMDEAFFFYYADNLELLESLGVEIVCFSPVHDERLPEGTTALYLGGGYPERHAQALAENKAMRLSVKQFADADRPVYAECGGMMYLSEQLIDLNGDSWPMAGVIPISTRMLTSKKRLGYTQTETRCSTILGPTNTTLRGHEFHYSEVVQERAPDGWLQPYNVVNARGGSPRLAGYTNANVVASYVHQHFASSGFRP